MTTKKDIALEFIAAKRRVTPLIGKKPAIKEWRTKVISEENVQKIDKKYNWGTPLSKSDLCIDIDPRNYENGIDSFKKLLTDLGPEFEDIIKAAPTVRTGNNGMHIYLEKPEELKTSESVPYNLYPGLEFKTHGRQLVIPGSVHPDTGNVYKWKCNSEYLSRPPKAPQSLLNLITKVIRKTGSNPLNGLWTPEQLANCLSTLPVKDFRDHDTWFAILAAAHNATNGDGLQEFLDWSLADQRYAKDEHKITPRWTSLDFPDSSDSPITVCSIIYYMKKYKDGRDLLTTITTDYEDYDTSESIRLGLIPAGDKQACGPLTFLNGKYCHVIGIGRRALLYETKHEIEMLEGKVRTYPIIKARHITAVNDGYINKLVSHPNTGKSKTLLQVWREWKLRNSAEDAEMDIEGTKANNFNLFCGYAVQGERNADSVVAPIYQLIREGICNGVDEYNEYVLNWIALMIQKPHIIPQTALAIVGRKGCGKSVFANVLVNMIGKNHAIVGQGISEVFPRYNDGEERYILVVSDEALPLTDEIYSKCKARITNSRIEMEGKFKNKVTVKSHLHYIFLSNERDPVRITPDERRYFYIRHTDKFVRDYNFFNNFMLQTYRNGGLERFMYDMKTRDISQFQPNIIPETPELSKLRISSFNRVHSWIVKLCDGLSDWPTDIEAAKKNLPSTWATKSINTYIDELFQLYQDFETANFSGIQMTRKVFEANIYEFYGIDKTSLGTRNTKKEHIRYCVNDNLTVFNTDVNNMAIVITLPSIAACRRKIDRILGGGSGSNRGYPWSETTPRSPKSNALEENQ